MKESFLLGSQCDAERTTDSFEPILVDDILQDIKDGQYRKAVEAIRRYRNEGNIKKARMLEGRLPIIYPGANLSGMGNNEYITLNGIAVVTMRLNSPLDAEEVLRHVRAWEFVKGYFTNVRGDIVVLIWLGLGFAKASEFRALREQAVRMMNLAVRSAHFRCRARIIRGVMAAYDPNCYIRADSELECPQTLPPYSIVF